MRRSALRPQAQRVGTSPSGQAVEPFIVEDSDVEIVVCELFHLLGEETYVVLLVLWGAVCGPGGEQCMEGGLQDGALGSAMVLGVSDFAIENLKEPYEQPFLLLLGIRVKG